MHTIAIPLVIETEFSYYREHDTKLATLQAAGITAFRSYFIFILHVIQIYLLHLLVR
jgi:hypothetical protein